MLISSQQTAYVSNRFVGESGRLISDFFVNEKFKTKSYLVTIDIEEVFGSFGSLLIKLEKFCFGTNFIDWIKIFSNDQELCVINGGVTPQYFKLEKGAQQGDPVYPG